MAKKKYYGLTGGCVAPREKAVISEDMSAIANMPTQAKIVRLPSTPYGEQPFLGDSLKTVDAQIRADLASGPRKKDQKKY